MKKIAYLFLSLLACSLALGRAQSDPIYQGKPESYWVDLLTNRFEFYPFQTEWRRLSASNEMAVLIKAVGKSDGLNAAIIRTNAASILSQSGDPKILLPIATNTSDPQVKMCLLHGLMFNADKAITEVMVQSLTDDNQNVRAAALGGLDLDARGFIPGEVEALVKCLQDSDPTMRSAAASTLVDYQNSGLPSQRQEEVTSAAYLEITKATVNSNAYISKAANIALRQAYRFEVLPAYSRELWLSSQEITGTNWTARLRVVDEDNKPLAGADATVEVYIHDLDLFGHVVDRIEEIGGKTDSSAIFTASRKGFCPSAFRAEKTGYTPVRSDHDMLSFKDDDPQRWHPSVTLVLKKKEYP